MQITETTDTTKVKLSDTTKVAFSEEEGYTADTLLWQSEDYSVKGGARANFIAKRYIAGNETTVSFDRYLNGSYDTTLLYRAKQVPASLQNYTPTTLSYNHEFLQESIDVALLQKGNRQLWSGIGLTGASMVSHFILHRQEWPVRQTINGMGYYDKENPYREANLQARTERMWLYIWEGATYLATGTGVYLIIKGVQNKNAAVIVTPTTIGLKVQF